MAHNMALIFGITYHLINNPAGVEDIAILIRQLWECQIVEEIATENI